uniref:Uncharacterized protein n=1 Tax=Anguilla anguilla TaxID=7936 RepID=A0A0E9WHK3_ANGAN
MAQIINATLASFALTESVKLVCEKISQNWLMAIATGAATAASWLELIN